MKKEKKNVSVIWGHNTDTGVIVTQPFIFLLASGPIVLVTHAQLTVVTQSCAVLCTVTYCCSDAIVLVMSIVDVTLLFSYST